MHYAAAGPRFAYHLEAHGLRRHEGYTLAYLPFADGTARCLGAGTTNAGGALRLADAPDLNGDLPAGDDPDRAAGARVALVLTSDVDCGRQRIVAWQPDRYLFGRRRISYHDTDVRDYTGDYCIVTRSPDRLATFQTHILQSGGTITATLEGVVASGPLSGDTATLAGAVPDGPFTLVLVFADDGATLSGTLTIGADESSVTGTVGACSDYAFPSGDPICALPVTDPSLVVGGQQFNSVSADGVTHTGLDFEFATALPSIVAPCDGVIVEINRHPITLGNVIFDVVIKYNDDWSTFIAFEPYSPDPIIAAEQAAQLAVTINQVVHRGDLLGRLVVPSTEYPHVHWGVTRSDAERTPVCPRDYLTPDAQLELDELYTRLGRMPACLP